MVATSSYKPSLSETVSLSTGKNLHLWYDHPNHNGFTKQDHALAADFHDRKAKNLVNFPRARAFHFAQRDLHTIASNGKSTRIGHVPSEAFLSSLPSDKQDFWRTRAKEQRELNDHLKSIEKYRMSNMLGDSDSGIMKMFKIAKSSKKLNKSRTSDAHLAKKVEMDRQPPPPPVIPQEAKNSIDPEYRAILDSVLKRRSDERHSNCVESVESDDDNKDPRDRLSDDQLDSIRQAIASRQRGGSGW